VSWALLQAEPSVKSTSPLMSGVVCRRVSLCTEPIFSSCTVGPGCSGSPRRLHTGARSTGWEISHWKQASPGAPTSTSSRGLTIVTDWAGGGRGEGLYGVLPKTNQVVVLPKTNQVVVLPKTNQEVVLPKTNQVVVLTKTIK